MEEVEAMILRLLRLLEGGGLAVYCLVRMLLTAGFA